MRADLRRQDDHDGAGCAREHDQGDTTGPALHARTLAAAGDASPTTRTDEYPGSRASAGSGSRFDVALDRGRGGVRCHLCRRRRFGSRTGRTLRAPRRSVTWTLRCDPARGTLARPARACARLAAGGAKLFAPLPQNAVCTEIYGGPQKARVVGVVDGKRVWSTFTRTERLPDRPLAAHLALARASGRRHELTTGLVTIGGREDRPLRRRRAPPAPRDRAGPRARPARRGRRSQRRGARASRRPTSQRSSTSATSPPWSRSRDGSASTACSRSPPIVPCRSSRPSPRSSGFPASGRRRLTS